MADFDYNNLTNQISNNAPATIAALGSLFNKQTPPVVNYYQSPDGAGKGDSTMLIGLAAVAVIIALVFLKK